MPPAPNRLAPVSVVGLAVLLAVDAQAQLRITDWTPTTRLTVINAFTNGVCTVECADLVEGPWLPQYSRFTTADEASLTLGPNPAAGLKFYRVRAADLNPEPAGFGNLIGSYSWLTTVAGAGGSPAKGENKWRPEFEGGPAVEALLSRPHIAMTDSEGNLYIADKDAHGIRRVTPDGLIRTVAGVNMSGDGPDVATPGDQVALSSPNGLWVGSSGVVFILDLNNGKVRRLARDGTMSTLFVVPGGISVGRGLWVSDDENLAYVAAGNVVKRWTPAEGVTDFATGFAALGNLVIDPGGDLVVTDRGGHRVYRIRADGERETIAGNGTALGGGEGHPAVETGLAEVRGVWFLPTGAFFVGTHEGSQVWYVDTDGISHLFLHGLSSRDSHAGDGTYFYNPTEPRLSEVRAVTLDHEGNLLITEHDAGFIRKVRFLPMPQ